MPHKDRILHLNSSFLIIFATRPRNTFINMKKIIVALFFAVAVLYSCKNDFDVNEDWKETMIVYGLLNPADTAQYIKINKAFLGEGNALVMAGEFDSLNYTQGEINAVLEQWNGTTLVQTIQLYLDTLIPKDTGVFASPDQNLYKTSVPIVQNGSIYKLKVLNERTGKVVTSETPVVQTVSVNTPTPNQTINIVGINPFKTKWTSAAEGRKYEVVVRFNYIEKLIFDTTQQQQKHVDVFLGTFTSNTLNGGEVLETTINPDAFYSTLGKVILPSNSVNYYYFNLEFIYSVAAENFTVYMDIVSTQSATFGDPPLFTNIQGGVGLFSSRYNKKVSNVKFSIASYDSLRYGQYTEQLGFQ